MMNKPFRIEARESFRVIGYCVHTTNKRKEGRKAIPQQWEELQTQGLQKDLLQLMNKEPFGLFGISVYNTAAEDRALIHIQMCIRDRYKVTVLSDCITSYDKRKLEEMLQYYEKKGSTIATLQELQKA